MCSFIVRYKFERIKINNVNNNNNCPCAFQAAIFHMSPHNSALNCHNCVSFMNRFYQHDPVKINQKICNGALAFLFKCKLDICLSYSLPEIMNVEREKKRYLQCEWVIASDRNGLLDNFERQIMKNKNELIFVKRRVWRIGFVDSPCLDIRRKWRNTDNSLE